MCESINNQSINIVSFTDEKEIKKVKQSVLECMRVTGMTVEEIVNAVFSEKSTIKDLSTINTDIRPT